MYGGVESVPDVRGRKVKCIRISINMPMYCSVWVCMAMYGYVWVWRVYALLSAASKKGVCGKGRQLPKEGGNDCIPFKTVTSTGF